MKSTGIVRKVDDLGRVVLPIEMRRVLSLEVRDAVEIFSDGENIVLKKYQPACVFCDSAKEVVTFKGRNVCASCARALGNRF